MEKKIYNSTEYINNPKVGDLKLKVNSMWDFGSRSVCFKDIDKTFGGGRETISYDLEECIEVIDEKTNHTKWKKADITEDIKERLKSNGYIIN